MSLLVTGSIGLDTIETPSGKRDNVIGGSAIYFSYAASFFTPVRLVGLVANPWNQNGRNGVAYRATAIEPVGAERKAS